MLQLIDHMLQYPKMKKKALEKFLGLAMWCTAIFPQLRPQLHRLFSDLHTFPETLYSCLPSNWQALQDCLDDDLTFRRVLLWFQPGIAPCDARLTCKMCQSQNVPFGCMFVTLDPLSGNCRSTHCAFCVNSKFGFFHEISWPQWDPRFLQMSEWKPMHVPQVLNVELADEFNPNNKLGGSLSNIPCQIFVHCRLKSKMIYRKISHSWKHSANVPSFGSWNHQLRTAD